MAMQTQKDRREQSLHRSLVVQGGEIGTVTHGHFQSYTNFSMEIVHAVSSPKGAKSLFGYVYSCSQDIFGASKVRLYLYPL